MTLQAGTRLGAYEILARLGAGGMGEVYRARDTRLGREIAIKVLPAAVASSPDRLARLEREARTVAALNHPSIVTLHSVEDAEGVRFLTMELIEGSTLQDSVRPGGIPIMKLLDLALPLADALVAAHASGVVHRDLKPGNVMVTRDGRVKVLDFGLAKVMLAESGSALGDTRSLPLTQDGDVLGTAPYMSPEQIRGSVVDSRSDIFSLGVILYELAVGERPFRAPTAGALASAILRDSPTPISTVRSDAPSGFDEIVTRCLEKDADDRYQTVLEMRGALHALRGALKPAMHEDRASDGPSIAVLPFANMSADPENEYFSDGLSEELLNVLTKIPDLKVIGRTSSFAFKGKNEDLRHIGKRLGVATLLEGSVRKAGNRVRITAQLVKVSDGFHLWSETYDRVLDDIFAVQDDIARAVSAALHVKLLGGRARAQASGASFERMLRANHFFVQNTASAIGRAVELYQEAIDENPNDAVAWAGLAKARAFQAGYGYSGQVESRREARKAVERALELDPHLADAHGVLSLILGYLEFRWQEAVDAAERALLLAPKSVETMVGLSAYLCIRGRIDEGLALARRAAELDPLNPGVLANLAKVEGWSGHPEQSLNATLRTLEISPAMTSMRGGLGLKYLNLGRVEEGMAEILKESSKGYRDHYLAIAYYLAGNRAESDAALGRLTSMGEEWANQIALVHATRGEHDDAFRWLHHAAEVRDPGVSTIHLTSLAASLRDDPRWLPFLRRVGLAQ
jgi:serine/threonine protein kinase/tetratricopeptide (TPR) repeat protein